MFGFSSSRNRYKKKKKRNKGIHEKSYNQNNNNQQQPSSNNNNNNNNNDNNFTSPTPQRRNLHKRNLSRNTFSHSMEKAKLNRKKLENEIMKMDEDDESILDLTRNMNASYSNKDDSNNNKYNNTDSSSRRKSIINRRRRGSKSNNSNTTNHNNNINKNDEQHNNNNNNDASSLKTPNNNNNNNKKMPSPARLTHRKNNSTTSVRLIDFALKYRNHEITRDEYLEIIKGEMKFSILKLIETYRSDDCQTETQEHVDECLYPLIVNYTKKRLQIKGKLDLRIIHDIQSIIYTYLDNCESGSIDIDHNIESSLLPSLIEFSSNLYLNAGADLLNWGDSTKKNEEEEEEEQHSTTTNNNDDDDTSINSNNNNNNNDKKKEMNHQSNDGSINESDWTKNLPTIPSLGDVLDDDATHNGENDDDDSTTTNNRYNPSSRLRRNPSESIDDTNNKNTTEQEYLDLIPPGKLEIEIKDCTLTQKKNMFTHPSIYVKTNCLWKDDDEKHEFKTSALPFIGSNKPIVWENTYIDDNNRDGQKKNNNNIETFYFPGGKEVKHEPRLAIGVYAERIKRSTGKRTEKQLGTGILNIISVLASPNIQQIESRIRINSNMKKIGIVNIGIRFIPSRAFRGKLVSPTPLVSNNTDNTGLGTLQLEIPESYSNPEVRNRRRSKDVTSKGKADVSNEQMRGNHDNNNINDNNKRRYSKATPVDIDGDMNSLFSDNKSSSSNAAATGAVNFNTEKKNEDPTNLNSSPSSSIAPLLLCLSTRIHIDLLKRRFLKKSKLVNNTVIQDVNQLKEFIDTIEVKPESNTLSTFLHNESLIQGDRYIHDASTSEMKICKAFHKDREQFIKASNRELDKITNEIHDNITKFNSLREEDEETLENIFNPKSKDTYISLLKRVLFHRMFLFINGFVLIGLLFISSYYYM